MTGSIPAAGIPARDRTIISNNTPERRGEKETLMSKMEFATQIAELMGLETTQTEKANGVIFTGVNVPTARENVKATVYIDQMYDEGKTIEEAVESIKEIMRRESSKSVFIDIINDFEKVRPMLRARLYNQATKADIYRSAAPYGFDDLIIVPYIENIIDNGSVKVTNGLLKIWGVDADQVLDIAEENAKNDVEVRDMMDVIAGYGADLGSIDPSMPQMIVVTNSKMTFGAFGIISKLDEFKEKFGSFTVLPSSVHEVIVVNQVDDCMTQMVKEVNDSQVELTDQLSDHAYTFAA